jgi:hypothetical protein
MVKTGIDLEKGFEAIPEIHSKIHGTPQVSY